MGKAEHRAKCRAKWGSSWYKVHPVIKKARLQWASGERLSDCVLVTELRGLTYTV
jgi:hypothetical protein